MTSKQKQLQKMLEFNPFDDCENDFVDDYGVKQIPSNATERERELYSELWHTQQDLRYTQRELERLAQIVEQLQNNLLDSLHYCSMDVSILRDDLKKHTSNFHAMLIVGRKESKDESNIS